ncbi:MAG: Rne/Rng family ribonuclease [Gammaproteobacteria bacterium]|nr:Rne/Rng family ribonuclease [Gammaproteobacteria bacterium]
MKMNGYQLVITVFGNRQYLAVLQGTLLKYFFVETQSHHSAVGQIYCGKVVRMMPGIDAAFVEIGQERAAFLHKKDMCTGVPSAGQKVLVQVLKDPISTKGARLTTDLTIPSTYLVYQPFAHENGISQKITSEDERTRLRQWLVELDCKGIIIRTAAQGASYEELQRDYEYLMLVWNGIQESMRALPGHAGPQRIWADLDAPLRIIRDLAKLQLEKIYVNSETLYANIVAFMKDFFPHIQADIVFEKGSITGLSRFQIAHQVMQSLAAKIPLLSGGTVIIEQTESMVTVDVNTSGFIGSAGKDADDTILKTNLEAVAVLERQIPLRELGGVIVIDFIDMQNTDHRAQLEKALESAFESDLMPTQIFPISPIGLVQMTRKRTTESGSRKFLLPCPCCNHGHVLVDAQLLLLKALAYLERITCRENVRVVILAARPDVLTFFNTERQLWIDYHGFENATWETREIHGVHNELTVSVLTASDLEL